MRIESDTVPITKKKRYLLHSFDISCVEGFNQYLLEIHGDARGRRRVERNAFGTISKDRYFFDISKGSYSVISKG